MCNLCMYPSSVDPRVTFSRQVSHHGTSGNAESTSAKSCRRSWTPTQRGNSSNSVSQGRTRMCVKLLQTSASYWVGEYYLLVHMPQVTAAVRLICVNMLNLKMNQSTLARSTKVVFVVVVIRITFDHKCDIDQIRQQTFNLSTK